MRSSRQGNLGLASTCGVRESVNIGKWGRAMSDAAREVLGRANRATGFEFSEPARAVERFLAEAADELAAEVSDAVRAATVCIVDTGFVTPGDTERIFGDMRDTTNLSKPLHACAGCGGPVG